MSAPTDDYSDLLGALMIACGGDMLKAWQLLNVPVAEVMVQFRNEPAAREAMRKLREMVR